MEQVMAFVLILIMLAVLAVALILFVRHGTMGGSGISSTAFMGASFELLSQDQRKAAEVIVEDNAGSKHEDDMSGESLPPSPGKQPAP